MTGTKGDRRTETARANDDSDLIDAIEPAPSQRGSAGGNLQRDIGAQAETERVSDPDAREGVTKEDELQYTGSKPDGRRSDA